MLLGVTADAKASITGLSKLQWRCGNQLQSTWQVRRATRHSQVRQTLLALPWPGSQWGGAACIPQPNPAILPRGSGRTGTGVINSSTKPCPQSTANLPVVTSPRAHGVHTCPVGCPQQPYSCLPKNASQRLNLHRIFMSRKLFLFVFKESNFL